MSEQPLFQGTNEDAILTVLNAVLEKAFGDLLVEPPIHEMVPAELKLEEIVDIGDGYKTSGRSPLMAMVSVASVMHTRSKKGKGVWTTWLLTTLRLKDTPSEIKILFQGGFVKDKTFAFNAASMGFVHDVMIPRGFGLGYANKSAVFERASLSTDTGESRAGSPFISVYETQAGYESSKMNQTLDKIPHLSYVQASGRFSGTTYESSMPPKVMMSPRHGNTLISLRFSLYGSKTNSDCVTFMMPGETKPWKLEVAAPAPENFMNGYNVLKEAMDIPEYLTTDVEVTGELGGGVDVYLALETARQRFSTVSNPFTLTDVVRSTPEVQEVLNELRTKYPVYEMDVAGLLKGTVLRKL